MFQYQGNRGASGESADVNTPDLQDFGSERLRLRPLVAADHGVLSLYLADKRVAENTATVPHPLTPGLVENMLERAGRQEASEFFWAIEYTQLDDSPFAGLISLEVLSEQQSELRFWVAPQFWNSGLASEALRLLIARNPLGNHSIVASIFQDNPASAKVVERLGCERVGESECYALARGKTVPSWDYIYRFDVSANAAISAGLALPMRRDEDYEHE